MPPIFKALATIMVWVLWISALVMGFSSLVLGMVRGDVFSTTKAPPMVYAAMFTVAGFYAIVAAVIMLIRKKME